jgi:hypothetical protein
LLLAVADGVSLVDDLPSEVLTTSALPLLREVVFGEVEPEVALYAIAGAQGPVTGIRPLPDAFFF